MNRKRVHAARKLRRQHVVDQAVAREPALAAECFSHDMDPEMGLAARPVPGVAFVAVGFIDHVETLRCESLRQFFGDDIAGCHGVRIVARRAPVNAHNCGRA